MDELDLRLVAICVAGRLYNRGIHPMELARLAMTDKDGPVPFETVQRAKRVIELTNLHLNDGMGKMYEYILSDGGNDELA